MSEYCTDGAGFIEEIPVGSLWEENRVVGRVFARGGQERRVIRRMWRVEGVAEKTVRLVYVHDAVAQQVFRVPAPEPSQIDVDKRALRRWFHR